MILPNNKIRVLVNLINLSHQIIKNNLKKILNNKNKMMMITIKINKEEVINHNQDKLHKILNLKKIM